MTDDPKFLACMPFMLIEECPLPGDWSNPRNFSNDAHDPGGATMCGIIQTEYNAYRRLHGLPIQAVRQITKDEGYDIYYNSYWLPHCPVLPPGLNLSFFDEVVNTGPSRAVRVLQTALGIPSDGIWGPQTAGAVAVALPVVTIQHFTTVRAAVYRSFGGFRYFGTGWISRTNRIGRESLQMAEGTVK